MCGRFTFHEDREDIRAWLDSDDDEPFAPSWNIAPTQPAPVIRADPEGHRHLVAMRWGLIPSWAKDKKIGSRLINARADTITQKPSFRTAFQRRRCLVLMSGYYEWKNTSEGKIPYLIRGLGPIAAAGLWEKWQDPTNAQTVESCTIITTDAAASIRELHDRMPVLVEPAKHRLWLDPLTPPQAAQQLLLPFAGTLRSDRVDPRVNNVRNDGPDLGIAAAAHEVES